MTIKALKLSFSFSFFYPEGVFHLVHFAKTGLNFTSHFGAGAISDFCEAFLFWALTFTPIKYFL